MSIKTKLLLCLLSFSILILIVGMIFYLQLKNLIEPLTPTSIPISIENLEKSIVKNSLIYHLLYQQQTIQMNLEDYVLINAESNLQDYYMNQALFLKLLESAEKTYPDMFSKLKSTSDLIMLEENKIIQLMKSNNLISARKALSSNQFLSLRQNILSIINSHYVDFDILTNESAVVTVKLSEKNIVNVLFDSMNTTILIFIDAVAISLLFVFFGTNTIWRPIKLLRNNMENIMKKNLDIPVDPSLLRLKGEIGDLARSYGKLISSLQTTTVSRDQLLDEIKRRVKSEEDLRITAKDLAESNQELDQFAYSASHDLRAPLRGIQSLCEWIREDCYDILPAESRKHLDLLQIRAKRLDSLIHGILEYSRAGKPNSQSEAVDLNKLLADIIDSLTPPKNIKISIDMTMPEIVTYKALITQVFLNLISNAIKFNNKSQGYIRVGYKELDDYYKFYISDNGPGIEPIFHQKIFELFQTLQSRDTIEGAGIGLPLVKKIIDKQGGVIEVESILGKGTTFYFTWPKNLR